MNTRTRKLVYTALFAALTAVGAYPESIRT